MKILLYSPDNGVTRNFMPHLWMFLLKALTPPGHEVLLVDGNARPMGEAELARFVVREKVGLVGIGSMTRMGDSATPTRWRSARRTRPGPGSSRTPPRASSKRFTRPWTGRGRSESRACNL